jgi:hypothetical protein
MRGPSFMIAWRVTLASIVDEEYASTTLENWSLTLKTDRVTCLQDILGSALRKFELHDKLVSEYTFLDK